MAGETPGRVPVYTALPHPVTPRATTAKTSQFSARLDHDPDGHVTVQIHLQLQTATPALQHKPGIAIVVGANNVVAAVPIIEHADMDTTAAMASMVLPVKVPAWTRTSHWTSHSKQELPEACSYPCHALEAGITQRWSVVCCQEG